MFAAAVGLAVLASGCIIDGTTSSPDSDLDGIRDAFDDCPLQPETFNGFQDADGCPDSTTGCLPDLTISWRIVSNIDLQALTCFEAGGADTVTAWIDGGALGVNLTPFDGPCPTNSTQGSFVAELPASGSYNVSLELVSGTTVLSETPILVQSVDCTGLSATPQAELRVNF